MAGPLADSSVKRGGQSDAARGDVHGANGCSPPPPEMVSRPITAPPPKPARIRCFSESGAGHASSPTARTGSTPRLRFALRHEARRPAVAIVPAASGEYLGTDDAGHFTDASCREDVLGCAVEDAPELGAERERRHVAAPYAVPS